MTFRVDVITLFPEVVEHYAAATILGRAADKDVWRLRCHDPRDATHDVHRTVDDTPFGGGAGMVMKAEPLLATIRSVPDLPRPVVALTPSGRPLTHAVAREFAALEGVTLLCGRYEGIDQRVLDTEVDDEVSVGDFVLAGGELAALCLIEAVVRLRPGALGNDASVMEESFSDGLLEYPQYTKPAEVEGLVVPEILRSGDHARVARWRRAHSLRRTLQRRPDLLTEDALSDEDRRILAEFPDENPPAANG